MKKDIIKEIKESWEAQEDFRKLIHKRIERKLHSFSIEQLKEIRNDEDMELWYLEEDNNELK